jgi:hypothetical protein
MPKPVLTNLAKNRQCTSGETVSTNLAKNRQHGFRRGYGRAMMQVARRGAAQSAGLGFSCIRRIAPTSSAIAAISIKKSPMP